MDEQTKRISDQAADYLAGRQVETVAQCRAREAWLAEDARHRTAYDEMQQLWDHAGHLRDDAELRAFTTRGRAALRRSRWSKGLLLAAAAIAILVTSAWVVLRLSTAATPVRYATVVGQRQTEVLADGSQVTLNTDSIIEVRFSRGRRDVDLQRGEAQFDVAHDASRPFVVHTGMGTVTALGTRFDVRRYAGDEAVITLLRGSVAVKQGAEQRTLRPNEQARLSDHGGITVRWIDPAQVDAWVDGWLRFSDASLGEVVAEANRYSSRKLRLADPQLAGLRLHGNFHVGDTASIAAAAELLLPVRVEKQGNDIVLSPVKKK